MMRERNPSVGTTVSGGGVSLRLNSRFPTQAEAQAQLDQTAQACYAALGDLIYGEDDDTLQSVVARQLLHPSSFIPHPYSLTTAESCTGGLLAKLLTDIPGSSAYFKQGFITYSNEAKMNLLGVPAATLEQFGAVSEPTAIAIAEGARHAAKSDFALSITGIAGPDGGSAEKPVGTVCIALAAPDQTTVRTFHFSGDRDTIRSRSAQMALTLLRFHLLGKPIQ
jgi:nicotinamide-nucleotide amidase